MEEKDYNFKEIEEKWQNRWEDTGVFVSKKDEKKQKYYLLEMFPYPSGRLHMGHVRNYTIGDLVARFMRMKGITCFIPWAGTPSGFPPKMPP